MSDEMYGRAAAKGSYVGLGLQSAQGEYMSPDTWLPLLPAPWAWAPQHFPRLMQDTPSGGEWVEGSIRVPLVPGSVVALWSWIQERDANSQGRFASLLLSHDGTATKITDCKVRKARLRLPKEAEADCLLHVVALSIGGDLATSPTVTRAAPYKLRIVERMAKDSPGATSDIDCDSVAIDINAMLEPPGEGLKITPSPRPQSLVNLAGIRCSGTIAGEIEGTTLYQDYRGSADVHLRATLVRSYDTITFGMPHVLCTRCHRGRMEFKALGGPDGTPPIELL